MREGGITTEIKGKTVNNPVSIKLDGQNKHFDTTEK